MNKLKQLQQITHDCMSAQISIEDVEHSFSDDTFYISVSLNQCALDVILNFSESIFSVQDMTARNEERSSIYTASQLANILSIIIDRFDNELRDSFM